MHAPPGFWAAKFDDSQILQEESECYLFEIRNVKQHPSMNGFAHDRGHSR